MKIISVLIIISILMENAMPAHQVEKFTQKMKIKFFVMQLAQLILIWLQAILSDVLEILVGENYIISQGIVYLVLWEQRYLKKMTHKNSALVHVQVEHFIQLVMKNVTIVLPIIVIVWFVHPKLLVKLVQLACSNMLIVNNNV